MRFENLLAECLDDIAAGRLSIEEALQRYPQHYDELEPLLQAAVRVQRLPRVEAPASLRQFGRARLMAQITQRPVQRCSPWQRLLAGFQRPVAALQPAAAVVVVMVGLLLTSSVTASASSLPGDALYPVKRFGEQVQLAATLDSTSRAWLHVALAERRLAELDARADELAPEQVEDLIAASHHSLDAAEAVVQSIPNDSARGAVAGQIAQRRQALAQIASAGRAQVGRIDDGSKLGKKAPTDLSAASTRVSGGVDDSPSSASQTRASEFRQSKLDYSRSVTRLTMLVAEARTGRPEKVSEALNRYLEEIDRLGDETAQAGDDQRAAAASELHRQRQEIERVLPSLPPSSQAVLQRALAVLEAERSAIASTVKHQEAQGDGKDVRERPGEGHGAGSEKAQDRRDPASPAPASKPGNSGAAPAAGAPKPEPRGPSGDGERNTAKPSDRSDQRSPGGRYGLSSRGGERSDPGDVK